MLGATVGALIFLSGARPADAMLAGLVGAGASALVLPALIQ